MDPSSSIWFKLLNGQWKHIKSLHIPYHPLFRFGHLVETSLQLDAFKLMPKLHTLLLSNIEVKDMADTTNDPYSAEELLKKENNTLRILKASLLKALVPLIEMSHPIDATAITAIHDHHHDHDNDGLLTLTGGAQRPRVAHLGLPGTVHMSYGCTLNIYSII
jgi:hypothetical protein